MELAGLKSAFFRARPLSNGSGAWRVYIVSYMVPSPPRFWSPLKAQPPVQHNFPSLPPKAPITPVGNEFISLLKIFAPHCDLRTYLELYCKFHTLRGKGSVDIIRIWLKFAKIWLTIWPILPENLTKIWPFFTIFDKKSDPQKIKLFSNYNYN